jgi:PAS domain-containing protein
MPFAWDDDTQTYRNNETGEEIHPEDLIDEVIDGYVEDIDYEEEDAEEVNEETKDRLKTLYLILALLALGGSLTVVVRRQLERRLTRQYTYLDQFTRAITQRQLTPGEVKRRLQMYYNSSRQAFWLSRKSVARSLGYNQERWITVGDERVCSPCVEAGQMQWQPLGTFGEPGSGQVHVTPPSECSGLTNCRCRKEWR